MIPGELHDSFLSVLTIQTSSPVAAPAYLLAVAQCGKYYHPGVQEYD